MKIMIIDDEPDIRTYLMTALEDEGYDTCTVDEEKPVETEIRLNKPDLIILDIMMPKRSGISIYKELRSVDEFKNIPIVLLSGMSPAKDFIPEGFRGLVDDESISVPDGFLEKPVQLPVLLHLVEKIRK